MNKINLFDKIENPPSNGSDVALDIINNPVSQSILLSNAMQSKFSQFFQRHYNIGAVEWRMLVVLAREPDITVSTISETLRTDKAAVSRALYKLHEKRLADPKLADTNARSKFWQLTPAGLALHDVILEKTLSYIREIIRDIPEESLCTMLDVMKTMQANMSNIDWDTSAI